MFKEKYIVWYLEKDKIKFMEFNEYNCQIIKEIFTDEEIIKIEIVLED